MRPEYAIAQVWCGDEVVGLAFLISGRHLVTCAHVVNRALGRPLRDPTRPDRAELLMDFPFGATNGARAPVRYARLVAWLPRGNGDFDQLDVAMLELAESPPTGVAALKWSAPGAYGSVQMLTRVPHRQAPGYVTGVLLGATDSARFHVDQDGGGTFRAAPGSSGGPVWQPRTRRVVGMLQAAAQDQGTDAYVLGAHVIAQVCPGVVPSRPVRVPRRRAEWRLPAWTRVFDPWAGVAALGMGGAAAVGVANRMDAGPAVGVGLAVAASSFTVAAIVAAVVRRTDDTSRSGHAS